MEIVSQKLPLPPSNLQTPYMETLYANHTAAVTIEVVIISGESGCPGTGGCPGTMELRVEPMKILIIINANSFEFRLESTDAGELLFGTYRRCCLASLTTGSNRVTGLRRVDMNTEKYSEKYVVPHSSNFCISTGTSLS